jgi:hypothetical protein
MQLDGPDLEELLLRARQEYGSDVRIVKADKVRTGGVGGFFTREQYELSIEVDEPYSGSDVSAASASKVSPHEVKDERPASLLDLAEAISDRESQARPQTQAPRAAERAADPRGMSALVDAFTPGVPAGPALSTDGASFANILAGLTASVAGPASSEKIAERSKKQPTAEREPVVRPTIPTPETPKRSQPTRRRAESRPARRPRADVATRVSLRDLRDLGLPAALLPTHDDGDVFGALVNALRRLPVAPQLPTDAGDVIAVVGEGEGAWDAAAQVVSVLGLEERALVYLTGGAAPTKIPTARRITSLDQIPSRLDRWRRRTTPTVAVVDAPMNVKAASWNRKAVTALKPDAVWAVASATRKAADVARWIDRIGRTDGLVITDVDASSDPASVLELGVPVAWLDGRPATPGAWAGLIVDRLVEAR